MKKTLFFVAALVFGFGAQAQDTYLNNMLVNGTGDLYGTSRYVGMGGAMGALGADLSTMSFNPAGIALYRRSDISITAGALWNQDGSRIGSNSKGTFDQAGGVFASRPSGNTNFVFGFNYQKKINYNSAFDIVGGKLNGLSQMDLLADLVNYGYDARYNLAGLALNPYNDPLESYLSYDAANPHYYNMYRAKEFDADYHFSGSLNSYDLDFAFNHKDRIYVGFDMGFESLSFDAFTRYSEWNDPTAADPVPGDYTLNNDIQVTGWGFNMKFGIIARPFEESPFRIGLAVETPTWYRLRNSTLFDLYDDFAAASGTIAKVRSDQIESIMNYRLTTPWRVRASMGSTIGNYLAWDVDYEVANWSGMSQKYENTDDYRMTQHVNRNLATMHLLKVGVEGKLSKSFALRAGYNYASAPMTENVSFDQCDLNSLAMDYATRTSYMRMKPTNIITLGMGYKYKSFYADIAYKLRSQKADFYAFDTTFDTDESEKAYFTYDFPELKGQTIDPVEINKTTHQITATLGFKF